MKTASNITEEKKEGKNQKRVMKVKEEGGGGGKGEIFREEIEVGKDGWDGGE